MSDTRACYKDEIIQVKFMNVSKNPLYIAKLFELVAQKGVNIDMISQVTTDNSTEVRFTCDECDQDRLNDAIAEIKKLNENLEVYQNKKVSKIWIKDKVMENTVGFAARIFMVLGMNQIVFHQVTTSVISISFVIDKKDRERAVNAINKMLEGE